MLVLPSYQTRPDQTRPDQSRQGKVGKVRNVKKGGEVDIVVRVGRVVKVVRV
jgi:hypothetical protein